MFKSSLDHWTHHWTIAPGTVGVVCFNRLHPFGHLMATAEKSHWKAACKSQAQSMERFKWWLIHWNGDRSAQIAEQSEPFRNIEKHVGHILSCFVWLHEPAPTTSCLLLINQLLWKGGCKNWHECCSDTKTLGQARFNTCMYVCMYVRTYVCMCVCL
jgi:hypothetical protein